MSIGLLLTSARAEGLFSKAIMESNVGAYNYKNLTEAAVRAFARCCIGVPDIGSVMGMQFDQHFFCMFVACAGIRLHLLRTAELHAASGGRLQHDVHSGQGCARGHGCVGHCDG